MDLKLEIQKMKKEYEALEAKFRALEAEKLANEKQLDSLQRENAELKERIHGNEDENKQDFGEAKKAEKIVDLTDDDDLNEDLVTQLMIENKVLECEKKKAERDVYAWESKFKALQLWVQEIFEPGRVRLPSMEKSTGNKEKVVNLVDIGSISDSLGKGIDTSKAAGSPSNSTPAKIGYCVKEEGKGACSDAKMDYTNKQQTRRQLVFEKEKSSGKKIAPSTPAGGSRPPHLSVVDISDSEEDLNNNCAQLPAHDEAIIKTPNKLDDALEGNPAGNKIETTEMGMKDIEDMGTCKKTPLVSTPKRKRTSNVVMSDSESDDCDNIPIGRLKRMNIGETHRDQNGSSSVTTRRTRRVPLRTCRGNVAEERKPQIDTTETKYRLGIPTNASTEDDESDEVGSDSEGESLGGFIVSDSDVSGGDDGSGESDVPEEGKLDFSEVLGKIQRKKERKYKWDFEAEMLADFGKDAELCMKAVCALYRQQTSQEKSCKETIENNCRGFSKFDAPRGTKLAEFLTAGDPQGDLQKTMEELQKHDPKAVEICISLARHYSKQLFAIYKNKEDPFFSHDNLPK